MLTVIKYNIKLLVSPSYVLGWLLVVSFPFLMNTSHLNHIEMTKISEQTFCIIGIIWFGNISSIERCISHKDLIYQMPLKHTRIFLFRFVYLMLNILMAFSITLVIASLNGANFNLLVILLSSSVNALFLGLITLFLTQISNEIAVGYMGAFIYYFFEYMTKGAFTRYFYLFGQIDRVPYNKVLLLCASIVLFIINFYMLNKKLTNNV